MMGCFENSNKHSASVIKSKAVPLRHAGAMGERKYNSYSFLTSALDGVSSQRHVPAALYPRYPLDVLCQYSVWLRSGRPGDRGSIPGRGKEFSYSLCVQTGCGAHPASYPVGTRGPFPEV
jgi:hypothetical protein